MWVQSHLSPRNSERPINHHSSNQGLQTYKLLCILINISLYWLAVVSLLLVLPRMRKYGLPSLLSPKASPHNCTFFTLRESPPFANAMPLSLYETTIPCFIQYLQTTSKLLTKGIARTSSPSNTVSEKDLLETTLVGDMGDLIYQSVVPFLAFPPFTPIPFHLCLSTVFSHLSLSPTSISNFRQKKKQTLLTEEESPTPNRHYKNSSAYASANLVIFLCLTLRPHSRNCRRGFRTR